MAEAMMGFSMSTSSSPGFSSLRQRGSSYGNHVPVGAWQQVQLEGGGNGVYQRKNCGGLSRRVRVNAVPAGDQFHLMAVLVQHMEGQRDLITVKSIWHLSDQAIKNVYMFYIMFFCWGCLFFGSTKDPYYDSEAYRKDGGDGTGHWVYEKVTVSVLPITCKIGKIVFPKLGIFLGDVFLCYFCGTHSKRISKKQHEQHCGGKS
ncbi:unnamed protein product [Linum tenue]|uniref:Uncharacterized protein n=1 Tax=Linum tenue TaxID=586396 RepID=A0AAV0RSB1_9ROSI|nr:unnamed protein product [Linum tenue]